MKLPFLDRTKEIARLRRHLDTAGPSLLCLYGRRRCGKSRLLRETMAGRQHVYYVADEREGVLQRRALAREMARLLPRLDAVEYPGWEELLERFWHDAPPGTVLAIDEFPWLVAQAPELPSLLQKWIDVAPARQHVILCGSSQRMMLGFLLDARAPLYGRAQEILKIEPLPAPFLKRALPVRTDLEHIEQYSVWGGVPRYWELAADYPDLHQAIAELVLDPMGVLHMEPERLLMDDIRDIAQASSILSLIGAGCQRTSEIAGRLGHPATSLSRPLARLIEMGLIHRELPFAAAAQDTKRSFYRIHDPFLAFYYRFVAPNRSRLGAGQVAAVARELEPQLAQHSGLIWEDLVRSAVPYMGIGDISYGPAARWWGSGIDGKPLEIDVIAEAKEQGRYLVAEVKRSLSPKEAGRLLEELRQKAARCPALSGKQVAAVLFTAKMDGGQLLPDVFTAGDVLAALDG